MPLPHVQPTTADPRRRLASSPTGGGLRWGGRPALPRHPPLPPTPPNPYHALLKPALSPSKPALSLSKGGHSNHQALAGRGSPARFTSKCRKMSQNVALFHTPTRRMPHFTSKKPHDLGPFPTISAHFRSIRSSPAVIPMPRIPSFPCPDTGTHAPLRRLPRLYLLRNVRTRLDLRSAQLEGLLKVQPQVRRCAEEAGQA